MTRVFPPSKTVADERQAQLPIFFGHILVPFAAIDEWLPTSQTLNYCVHVYDGVRLSPGSSQLPPDVLQDILDERLKWDKDEMVDAAIFSSASFPDWFKITIPDMNKYVLVPFL